VTIPAERTRAVLAGEDFLVDLLTPAKTPRVPKAIRERARRVLRHYPGRINMKLTAQRCPEIWGAVE